MATLRDVARLAGVSLATASRVVNGYKNVRESTRQQVLKVMRDLNYSYEYRDHARKNITIGVLVSKDTGNNLFQHPTVHSVIMGVIQCCNDKKIMNTMLLIDVENPQCGKQLINKPLNAYILIGTSKKEEDLLIPLLQGLRVPFVVVNRWFEYRHISYVNVDDYNTIREATLRMIDQGHRTLAFANGRKGMRNSIERLEGFRTACKQKDIAINDEWIFHGNYDEENGYQVAETIAKLTERPTLIMTSSDIIAIGIIKGLKIHGIKVPDEVSVVGFGDIPTAVFFQPSLTTIRMPSVELGIEAVEVVMQMINKPIIHHIKFAMDCEFIERESTRRIE